MKLSNNTLAILKNFGNINSNLVIRPGKEFATMAPSKDIMAEYVGDDEFVKQMSIFNLNEFLGAFSAFNDPDLDIQDKYVRISEGKQSVRYSFADDTLLTTPTKKINFPTPDVVFSLTAEQLAKIQKMASILSVEYLTFIGDGEKVIARVSDVKNDTGNRYDVDLDTKLSEEFKVIFRIEKLKVIPSGYTVEISSKGISKFTSTTAALHYYIAIETSSTF